MDPVKLRAVSTHNAFGAANRGYGSGRQCRAPKLVAALEDGRARVDSPSSKKILPACKPKLCGASEGAPRK